MRFPLLALSRPASRIALNIGLDATLAALAVPLARWLANPSGNPMQPAWLILWGAVALLLAGAPFRLSTQYWRFATIGDLIGVGAASLGCAALFVLGMVEAGQLPEGPAFPVVHAMTLVLLLGLPRIAYRLMQEGEKRAGPAAQTVLLIGAGEGADLFLQSLAAERDAPLEVVGLLSLGESQTGRRIHNHLILGSVAQAGEVLRGLRARDALPQALVLTDADVPGPVLAGLIAVADREGLRVARAPRPTSLDEADAAHRFELRPVAIEDLLNRPQLPLDRDGMARLIHGRRVLVTGAGGTIGSELARQVAAIGPETLVLLDNGEYALWQIDQELGVLPSVARFCVIADIRDAARLQSVMEQHRPELVFHAAALKHVPMVEANPLEGLLTNAQGTRNVADAARAVGALAMVLISTDKAVNPTSVMGASKRLAEMYCQALDIEARAPGRESRGMRCITVRFGNVLGSTGSVVPLFQRQLARGGPLTVTHPDMQRYFMTVREAVGLVLEASVAGMNARIDDGGIFVLDMGEPVKIVDLARQMIRLAGLRPEQDIEIRFTGLRPGEKLFEELFHGREPPRQTGMTGLLMATPRTADPAIVGRAIEEIAQACRGGQTRLALNMVGRMIPEFDHNIDGQTGAARA
jgi:O-antigen biosynthesis protein WbqV